MSSEIAIWHCPNPEYPTTGTYTVKSKKWVMSTDFGACRAWRNDVGGAHFGHGDLPDEEEQEFLNTEITLKGGPLSGLVMKYNALPLG